jgi:6-pyruvoyl-tetrahydropterin synthase related domain
MGRARQRVSSIAPAFDASDARVHRTGRIIISIGIALLFYKLGGLSSPGYGLPKWQPWTWRPGPLFRNTLTTGGDTGAHVWTSTFVKRHLVGSLRATGWSKDWYAGFPVLHFYFPTPTWAIVFLSYLIPINVAFKLISVSGLFGLPFAAMFLARSARLSSVQQYLFGLASLLFLSLSHFEILGGNIISTMAGEFSFAISLSLGLVFLGLLLRVWRDGTHRVRAAVVLALAGTSHLLPTMFVGVASLALICTHINLSVAVRSFRRRFGDALAVAAVGGSLASFWIVPFAARLPYANDMGWERTTAYVAGLFPGFSTTQLSDAPRTAVATTSVAIGLAILGGLASLVRFGWAKRKRRAVELDARFGLTLAVTMALAGAAYRFTPQYRLWNERALPFYYLCAYLLASFGLIAIGRLFRAQSRKSVLLGSTALISLWSIGAPLRILPGAVPIPKWKNNHLSIQRADTSEDISSIDDWPAYNYNGYEAQDEWPEFSALINTMKRIGQTNGCGRAMWEYEDELDRYGTSMGPMLLPHFTDGCIGSMEGLYFESSATTPYHFLNASLLSARSSDPQRGLPYTAIDIATGVRHLQELGVRYYMAFSPEALRQAALVPDLRSIATSEYSRECSDEEKKKDTCPQRWEIYEVANSALVEGLPAQPLVVTGIGQSQTSGWLDVAVAQYSDPVAFPSPLAADGPKEWKRVRAAIAPIRKVGSKDEPNVGDGVTLSPGSGPVLPRVKVRAIEETNEYIRFHVDRPGIPVVVKVSYFPAWKAVGADGPWRLAPNLMVVVPTSNDVRLEFRRTSADWAGIGGSGIGLVGVVALGLLGRRRRKQILDATSVIPVVADDLRDQSVADVGV